MNMAIWIIVFVLLLVFAVYAWRMSRATDEDNSHDVGQAIMDFARAFPNEAIRSLHMTADGGAAFVRLHDNKAGFMRNMGSHYVCVMIDPERRAWKAETVSSLRSSTCRNIAVHTASNRQERRPKSLSGCSAVSSRRRIITMKGRCLPAPDGYRMARHCPSSGGRLAPACWRSRQMMNRPDATMMKIPSHFDGVGKSENSA